MRLVVEIRILTEKLSDRKKIRMHAGKTEKVRRAGIFSSGTAHLCSVR